MITTRLWTKPSTPASKYPSAFSRVSSSSSGKASAISFPRVRSSCSSKQRNRRQLRIGLPPHRGFVLIAWQIWPGGSSGWIVGQSEVDQHLRGLLLPCQQVETDPVSAYYSQVRRDPGSIETASLNSGKLDPLSDHLSRSKQRDHSALWIHAAFWREGSCRVRSAWHLFASRIGRGSLQGIRRPQSRQRSYDPFSSCQGPATL